MMIRWDVWPFQEVADTFVVKYKNIVLFTEAPDGVSIGEWLCFGKLVQWVLFGSCLFIL